MQAENEGNPSQTQALNYIEQSVDNIIEKFSFLK